MSSRLLNTEIAVKKVKELLNIHNIEYKCFTHDEGVSSVEANKIRIDSGHNYSLQQQMKCLVVKHGKDNYSLVVVCGDAKYSNKKLRDLLNSSNVRLSSPEEVLSLTGIQIGGVHPFGSIFNLKTYLDKNFLKENEVVCNCGDRCCSMVFSIKDYIKIENPEIVDIV